ncbi:polyphenol oxidase family protein [Arthrobacter citreus]|uniref:polyphenol oxidase family protein n=2 Tax=Micrococcales TaxID=85006 RepID=UPI0012643853|nr:polyphenol oxidase family protein [Arthrobacter gandavensis]
MFWWQTQAGDGLRVAFTNTEAGNLALHVGDDPDQVLVRRAALEKAMGVAPKSLRFMNQVHSADVALAGSGQAPAAVPTADAMVSLDGSAPLAVMVADCVPVVLIGQRPDGGVVTAVAHAGRKGLLDGVLANTVERMRSAGAAGVTAWIGPAVCGQCYEVPGAMLEEAAAIIPEVRSRTSWGTPALDLPSGAAAQLAALDVKVTRVSGCTLESADLYSHRRSSSAGRFAGLVWRV